MYILITSLWSHISRKRRTQLGVLLALMIAASFAEVFAIGSIFPFLAILTNPESLLKYSAATRLMALLRIDDVKSLLSLGTIFFIFAVLIASLLRIILIRRQLKISHEIGGDLSALIFKKVIYQPYKMHLNTNSSELISAIAGKANGIVGIAIMPILLMLNALLILLISLTLLATLAPVITMLALVFFGGVYLIIALSAKHFLLSQSQIISLESNRVIQIVQEALGGIRDILINGSQKVFCEIYKNSDDPLRKARAETQFIAASPRYVVEACGLVFMAAAGYYFTVNASEGMVELLPILGVFALGAQRTLPVFQQAYASWSSMRAGYASLTDSIELLNLSIPQYEKAKDECLISFSNSIEFKDVSFKYTPKGKLVLDKIQLSLHKNSITGIVGGSGDGKSTLLDILMGLLSPTSGEILIDGKHITQANAREWQGLIAHVPQHIFLIDGTIVENIAFGLPPDEIDLARVIMVCEKAQLREFIDLLPDGYQTKIGERGVRISGGQRQRIGIARALYKKASIIIFDEATSSLDDATEASIMNSIYSLDENVTMVIAAHRLSTLKRCGKILQIKDGKVLVISDYAQFLSERAVN